MLKCGPGLHCHRRKYGTSKAIQRYGELPSYSYGRCREAGHIGEECSEAKPCLETQDKISQFDEIKTHRVFCGVGFICKDAGRI